MNAAARDLVAKVGRIKVRVRGTRTGSAAGRQADPAAHLMRALDPPYVSPPRAGEVACHVEAHA
jgi:hypothetical protein